MKSTAVKFGEFVRYARKKKGLTQLELAEQAFGTNHHPYISKIESGKAESMTTEKMDQILNALDGYADFFQVPPKTSLDDWRDSIKP